MTFMAFFCSISCAVLAAVLTHVGVRRSAHRGWSLLGALLALACSFFLGRSAFGFWPGVYTALSVYFLTTVVTPWIMFLRQRHHA